MDFIDYQKYLNNQWKQIEQRIKDDEDFKKAGKGKIRISEVFIITLDTNNTPGLLIVTNNTKKVDKDSIPQCKGWSIEIIDKNIIMTLKNNDFSDFFKDIVNLILTKIYLNDFNEQESIQYFFEELLSAKNFFDTEELPRRLSPEKETGLFGELIILDEIIKKNSDSINLNFWTGPSQKHDFTLPNMLLETKTSKNREKKIVSTSSTDQLSPIFDKPLYLAYVKIEKNINGKSLNMLVHELGEKFSKNSEVLLNNFYLKLRQSGYYNIHEDEYNDKYSLNEKIFYFVSEKFPHIKRVVEHEPIFDLSITYKIDLDKCEEFRINTDTMLQKL